jgi:CheY-like chemotaxis protein
MVDGGPVSDHKRILAVALDTETFERIGPVLKRSSLSVEAVPQAGDAVRLAHRERFHLVICRYPLPDLKLREFVAAMRGHSSESRDASLMLLTIPEMMTEASAGIEGGPFMVFSGQDRAGAIGRGAAQLLQVAPRHAPRITTRLQVSLDPDAEPFVGWIVNLSTTGMLVTDTPMLPVGGRCFFEFTLPNGELIRGSAEVVRHAAPRREKVTGFAIRFIDLDGDGGELLDAWCQADTG